MKTQAEKNKFDSKKILEDHPDILAVFVAYEPDAFDGKDHKYINSEGHDSTGRFIPYWNRIDGDIKLEPLVDYETEDYYQAPKRLEQSIITDAYYYEGVFIVSFVSPIFKNGDFVGVAGIDVSLRYIDEVVSDIKPFNSGYALMTDSRGTLLTHPVNKEWIGNISLCDLENEKCLEIAEDIHTGKSGYVVSKDPVNQMDSIIFYEPIQTGNFSFILVVPKDEMLAGVDEIKRELIKISLIAIVFMGMIAYMTADSVAGSINRIVTDFKRISDDVLKGNLSARADTDVDIDFYEIPRGLNEILNTLQEYSQDLEKSNALKDESLHFLQEVMDAIPAPIYYTSRENLLLGCNTEFEKVMSVDREEIIGEAVNEIFPEHLNTEKYENNISALPEDGIHKFESTLRYPDGLNHNVIISKSIFESNTGKHDGVVGVIVDVSDKKMAEELRHSNELKDLFIDIMHHDLLNPTTVIKGLTEFLQEKETDEEKAHTLSMIEHNSEKLITMIELAAKIAKLEDTKQIELEYTNICSIMRNVLQSYADQIDENEIEIDLRIPNKCYAMSNPIIEDVFSNLLSNAIKYSPEKGKIIIDISDEEKRWKIKITDFGKGIPDEAKKIFSIVLPELKKVR